MFKARIKRPGQTLIEVAIATMIAAMTTVAVFSVALSSFVSQKKSDKKELAAMMLKEAQQTLQTFVSAVPGDVNYSPNAGGWWQADSLNPAWALSAGMHDISSLMPIDLRTDPVVPCVAGGSCYFVYTVTDADCGFGGGNNACKTVSFDMNYAD